LGGAPFSAPKKSASITPRGDHFPSTGEPLNVKLMRVLRTSPSRYVLSVAGWTLTAYSAFCPFPNAKKPLFMNHVALTKPPIVNVSPSPSLTTCPVGCWAMAGRALPSIKIPITASPEHHANRILMMSSSSETA